MRIPPGWTTEHAGGYGSIIRITHDECGWYTNTDPVLDEHRARQLVYGHECEHKREAREAAQRRNDQLDTLGRTVTALENALLTAVHTLPGIAVLDLRDPAVLRTSLATLHHTDRALITRTLAEFTNEDLERAIIDLVRTTVSDEDLQEDAEEALGFRTVIGVRFRPRLEVDGYYLSSDEGTVLFAEGDTTIADFPGIAPRFAEYCGRVGPNYSLVVDLSSSDATLTTYDSDLETIYERFGITETQATILVLLAEISRVLHECEPERPAVGVAFRTSSTEHEDGYFLDDTGEVLFADGTTDRLSFGDAGDRLARFYGNVGTKAVAWVDLQVGTITRDDDGFDTIHSHFNQPLPQ